MTTDKGKRPRDPHPLAMSVVDRSTSEEPEIKPETGLPDVTLTNLSEYLAAVDSKGGQIGGKRRLKTMKKPQPISGHKRGNPNWGKPMQYIPAAATEFETKVRELGLTKQTCAGSAELRTCCERNRNRCYIPEWLLDEWKIVVDGVFS
jgi:hypothetical protein